MTRRCPICKGEGKLKFFHIKGGAENLLEDLDAGREKQPDSVKTCDVCKGSGQVSPELFTELDL
jgi:RecJ-like exonuclease